jgi:hypothetical protein
MKWFLEGKTKLATSWEGHGFRNCRKTMIHAGFGKGPTSVGPLTRLKSVSPSAPEVNGGHSYETASPAVILRQWSPRQSRGLPTKDLSTPNAGKRRLTRGSSAHFIFRLGRGFRGGAEKLHQVCSSCLSFALLEEISCGFDHSHLLRNRRRNHWGSVNRNRGSQNSPLTLTDNPLPYGCG